MIDRAALEKLAARHLVSMQFESGISLLLHLHTGARYPGEDDLEDEMPLDARGSSIFDRLVLPYSAISYITLTAREPEGRSTIGFHTEWTAKKPG
jgi:hypothetical protein